MPQFPRHPLAFLRRLGSLVLAALVGGGLVMTFHAEAKSDVPSFRVIPFGASKDAYVPLLDGKSQSLTLQSAVVTLAPGKSSGIHSIENYEELLIILEGKGNVGLPGARAPIAGGEAVYLPPHATHDVVNDGEGRLRYVYVVAPARLP